jgi:uroporphyrinogen-III synthase
LSRLAGRTIAVSENRELDVFAGLLERRGANVLRAPLVAIRDAPDPGPVLAWIRSFAGGACDDLILLTGEGLTRLLGCIERQEPALKEPFIRELARVRKITRGPKPARALRQLGLAADLPAEEPTTQGILKTLRGANLAGHRIGVQLYGTEPNLPLVRFLEDAGARVLPVAPYVYVDAADDDSVRRLLERMSGGAVDAIAFTSASQVKRLFSVASAEVVRAALERTLVAALGPVVGAALERHGVHPGLEPAHAYFLKPLTSALEEALGGGK